MMWIRVYHSDDKDLANLVFASLKEKFPSFKLSLSSVDGAPTKINMEGEEDERPLFNYAKAFEKEFLKEQKAKAKCQPE